MNIVVTYDASVAQAPSAFKSVIANVVSYYDAAFTNPITVNIDVGWGEINGRSLQSGFLGQSLSFLTGPYTYSQVKAALAANAMTVDAQTAAASLPTSDPTNGAAFAMTTSQAKALGLMGASSALDGYAGFSSVPGTFDFTVTNNFDPIVANGEYDFFGTVCHEFSEVLGRLMNFGGSFSGPGSGNGYFPMDLFDYTAPGDHSFSASVGGRYFSIDGGRTNLDGYNTGPSGDGFDWSPSAGSDSFRAFSDPGVQNAVGSTDLTVMNALGYNLAPDFIALIASVSGDILSFQIRNQSQGAGPASTSGVYLSSSDIVTTADTLLSAVATPAIAGDGSENQSTSLALPATLAGGFYFVAVIADYNGAVPETDPLNNVSNPQQILILDNGNLNLLANDPHATAFVLAGLAVSGTLTTSNSLFVNAAVGGGGTLYDLAGNVVFGHGALLNIAQVKIAGGGRMDVQAYLAYGGLFTQGPSGSLTVESGGAFDLGGAGDSFAATVAGAGALILRGAGATFASGANLTIAEIIVAGAAVTVNENLGYANLWKQTAGTLTVAAGKMMTFTGVGDSFSGTLTGAGSVFFDGGQDTLRSTTLSAGAMLLYHAEVTLSGVLDLTRTLKVDSANLVIGDNATGYASLTGGGTLALWNGGTNRISGAGAGARLINIDDRIEGAGNLGGGQMVLYNEAGGRIYSTLAAGLTIDTGANTIVNAGLIESVGAGVVTIVSAVANSGMLGADGGNLSVEGAVSGTGIARIVAGVAEFESTFTEAVAFGPHGELALARSQTYTGTVSGFSRTGATSLDLMDIGFGQSTTASYSGVASSGVLTVSDGTHTARIKLAGDYLLSTFTLSSDGHGGTLVIDPANPSPHASGLSAQGFIAACASLAPTPAGPTTGPGDPAHGQLATLLIPRAGVG